jgi:hypothetical protein
MQGIGFRTPYCTWIGLALSLSLFRAGRAAESPPSVTEDHVIAANGADPDCMWVRHQFLGLLVGQLLRLIHLLSKPLDIFNVGYWGDSVW